MYMLEICRHSRSLLRGRQPYAAGSRVDFDYSISRARSAMQQDKSIDGALTVKVLGM